MECRKLDPIGMNCRDQTIECQLKCIFSSRPTFPCRQIDQAQAEALVFVLGASNKSYILPIYDENELPWLMEIKSLKSSTSFEKTLDSVSVQYRKFLHQCVPKMHLKALFYLK